MTKSSRSLTFKFYLILAILFFTVTISGCGVEPHSDSPKIKFVGAKLDENGVNIFTSSPIMETKIELSAPEDKTVFLEILTNDEYLQGKSQELVSGDDWGGKRFKGHSNIVGIATFNFSNINNSVDKLLDLSNLYYEFSAGQKYWVRSGVLVGQRGFGIIVSLIEIPIDKRSGHLFETITPKGEAIRVVFGVSDFTPFSVGN